MLQYKNEAEKNTKEVETSTASARLRKNVIVRVIILSLKAHLISSQDKEKGTETEIKATPIKTENK